MKREITLGDNTFIYDGHQVIVHNNRIDETFTMDKKSFKEFVLENMETQGGIQ